MTPSFRPEIQALRAISVMLVVLFHLYPGNVAGGYVGVDVFFVISGYLITSHLLREVDRTGGIKLSQFYARRIRRLLPAALLVLVTTLAAVIAFVPRSLWQSYVTDIGASAISIVNWVLAFNAVDYFAEDAAQSPVQHYWSLSVEEQFYLAWPLIIVLAVFATRKTIARNRTFAIGGVLGLIFVTSFIYSVVATYESQSFAYFTTFAHGWEFAAGGLLAIFLPANAGYKHHRIRSVLSWGGFAVVIASAFVFDADSLFPGWIAAVPVLATLGVIAAGTPESRLSTRWAVGLRPVQFIGDVSYSLYLWHWMPIVILPFILRHELETPQKIGILVGAILAAWLTKKFVEDPVRGSTKLRHRGLTYGLAATSTLILIVGCAIPFGVVDRDTAVVAAYLSENETSTPDTPLECFGAAAMEPGADCALSHELPEGEWTTYATRDNITRFLRASREAEGRTEGACARVTDARIQRCDIGSKDPEKTIVLVGDSHADQLLTPLYTLATQHNWKIIRLWKSSCRPALPVYTSNVEAENEPACTNWKKAIFDYVAGLEGVDAIVTSAATQGYYLLPNAPKPHDVEAGLSGAWQQWLDAGIPVLAVSDVPTYPGMRVPECIDASQTRTDPCATPRSETIVDDPILEAAQAFDRPDFASLDLYSYLCDEKLCHNVVGGLITHKDTNHLTSTFAKTLAPYLYESIESLTQTDRS